MKFTFFYKKNRNYLDRIDGFKHVLTNDGLVYDENNPDVVIVVGGDGTFLSAVNNYVDKIAQIKLVGINFGQIGFFCDYQSDEIKKLANDLKNNEFMIDSNPLLEGTIYSGNKTETVYALNEIRLESPFKSLRTKVLINGDLFEDFYGNGLLVCSPLGSSAYNKSIGGAVVLNDTKCLELSEIAPIQNKSNKSLGSSLIMSGANIIEFLCNDLEADVGYDSFRIPLNSLNKLEIKFSKKCVNFIRRTSFNNLTKIKGTFIK